MVPPTREEPYWSGWEASAGNGAVPYWRFGAPRLMNAVRHSPSNVIATLPFWNALLVLNSLLVLAAKNLVMLS